MAKKKRPDFKTIISYTYEVCFFLALLVTFFFSLYKVLKYYGVIH